MTVRRPLPLVSPFGPADVRSAAHAAVLQAFARRRSAAQAAEIAAAAGDWAVDLTERVKERLPPSGEIACSAGCAYCCHLKVLATAPEVIRLADHLRATRSAAELEAVRARVARAADATRGRTTAERAADRAPCPLLEDGRCVAYEARPLACRGAVSLDAAACARAFESPDDDVSLPVYKPQLQVADAVRAGLGGAAAQSRLDGRPLELVAALRIALEQPDAAAAWARGKPAFADAVDAEIEAMMRARGG